MLTLYQFVPCWGLPSASPFCIKLETWLRMAGIPFKIKTLPDPRKAPKGKLPFIEDNGKILSDSSLIIRYLKKQYRITLDDALNAEQQAVSLALQHLMEEHLYWVMVYGRWVDTAGWPLTKSAYFGHLPPFLQSLVPAWVRRRVKKTLYLQGIGRHSQDEIYQLGKLDIVALADSLGNKAFFLGDKPASLDATAFAFIAGILHCPIETPLKTLASQHENLTRYCQHMQETYYRQRQSA